MSLITIFIQLIYLFGTYEMKNSPCYGQKLYVNRQFREQKFKSNDDSAPRHHRNNRQCRNVVYQNRVRIVVSVCLSRKIHSSRSLYHTQKKCQSLSKERKIEIFSLLITKKICNEISKNRGEKRVKCSANCFCRLFGSVGERNISKQSVLKIRDK